MRLSIAPRPANSEPVRAEVVYQRASLLAAMRLAQEVSGLEDKEVAGALDIDPAQWSRIKSGQAHFPTNLYGQFMDIVGNEIPLLWLANSRGYELKPLRSELEQRIADLEAQLQERDRDLAVIKRFVQETR